MFSHAVKHLAGTGGSMLASRVMGSSAGGVKPVSRHYDIAMSYWVDEMNGNSAHSVDVNFPSGKYSALDYTPQLEHHRFVEWVGSDLPYDAEVEYLQRNRNTATYIDTGVDMTASGKWTVVVSCTDSGSCRFIGVGPSDVSIGLAMQDSGYTGYPHNYNGWNNSFLTSIDTRNVNTVVYDFSSGSQRVTVNGVLHKQSARLAPRILDKTIWLFRANHNSAYYSRTIRIHSCDMEVDGTLVRRFKPVRVGSVGYMYDQVEKKLYGAQGSGAFVVGPDAGTPSLSPTYTVVSPSSSVSYNIKVVRASWQSPTTVTFDAETDGGTMPSGWTSPDYYEGQPYGTLPKPTKSGEVFLGWFTSSGVRITESSAVTTGTLTARYAAVTYDTSFQVTTTSFYRKTGIYSATSRNTSNPTVVDWGDGTIDIVYGNISQLTHTYSSNGTFTVQVNDNISNIALSSNNSTWYNTTSQNRYTVKKVLSLGASLPAYAFSYCSAMTDALIPASATTIPESCFLHCSALKSVTIPSTITSIGNYAFYNCTGSSFTSVTIPSSVTSIGVYAFGYCYYLKSITFEPSNLTLTLNTYSFAYCFYQSSAVGTIDLSARKIASIPNYCFYYCLYLKGITWPQGVTSIGRSAFQYCFYYAASTGTVEIPEGVTSISGTYAFANCLYLTAVTLPSTLTNLNNYTFYSCTRLATITSNRSTAPTVSSATFGNGTSYYTGRTSYSAGTNRLYVPAEATGYNASYWSSVLLDATKCGFTLVQAVSITFDVSTGGGTMPSGWAEPNYWPGLAYGTLPVPEKSGATFDGWFLNDTPVTESSIVPAGGATLVAQFTESSLQKLVVYNDEASPHFSVETDYPLVAGATVTGTVDGSPRSGILGSNLYTVMSGGSYVGEFSNTTPGSDMTARWYDGALGTILIGYCKIIG